MAEPANETIDRSTRLTRAVSNVTGWLGSFPAIVTAAGLVASWFVGVFFTSGGFGNSNYQLLINTSTTIITFLMVFIIQNTTNRESRALHAKLDALLQIADPECENPAARALLGLEDAPERDIKAIQNKLRDDGPPPH